jgi:hypothetical protein
MMKQEVFDLIHTLTNACKYAREEVTFLLDLLGEEDEINRCDIEEVLDEAIKKAVDILDHWPDE